MCLSLSLSLSGAPQLATARHSSHPGGLGTAGFERPPRTLEEGPHCPVPKDTMQPLPKAADSEAFATRVSLKLTLEDEPEDE